MTIRKLVVWISIRKLIFLKKENPQMNNIIGKTVEKIPKVELTKKSEMYAPKTPNML
jgi:hypothetical protein